MKRITTVVSGTGTYEICKNEKGYWAIEHEYIGSDGRLKAPIDGIEGALRHTKEEAIDAAIVRGKIKEFKEMHNPTPEELLKFTMSIQ